MTNRRRIVAFVGALARADAQQGRIRCARLDGAAATRYSYARGEVQGRTCIVTGANSGIGFEVALGLARAGATTVLLCRDEARGAAACAAIRRASGNPAVHLRLADLASLASVRRFAAEFRREFARLDVLVNNAGWYGAARETSMDGLERTLAVGYLGPFLLTNLLVDRLRASAPARVVNLIGAYYRRGDLDLDDLQWRRRPYAAAQASNDAQQARALFTRALARRLEGSGVTVNGVHPGAVLTAAQARLPWHLRLLIHTILRPGFTRPRRGARGPLRLATDPALAAVSGCFFNKTRREAWREAATSDALAERLWATSAELVGL